MRLSNFSSSPSSPIRSISGTLAIDPTDPEILLNYLSILSPLIPLYVEEAWHYTPASLKGKDAVYKVGWFKPQEEWHQIDLAQDMQILEPLKECVLKILEEARQKQFVPNISRSNA